MFLLFQLLLNSITKDATFPTAAHLHSFLKRLTANIFLHLRFIKAILKGKKFESGWLEELLHVRYFQDAATEISGICTHHFYSIYSF